MLLRIEAAIFGSSLLVSRGEKTFRQTLLAVYSCIDGFGGKVGWKMKGGDTPLA